MHKFKYLDFLLFKSFVSCPVDPKSIMGIVIRTLMLPFLFLFSVRALSNNSCYIYKTEFVVTSKCSLRCKKCANLMQYYKSPESFDEKELLLSLNKYLECIDYVSLLHILGGEPFLYPHLDNIINLALSSKKVGLIYIFTNGTIIPSIDTLKALKKKRVKVFISDYGEKSKLKHELYALLLSNGINAQILVHSGWNDFGNLSCRDREAVELNAQFKSCSLDCRTVLNGKFYFCPRSAHGHNLGAFSLPSDQYVDLFKDGKTVKQIKDDILRVDRKLSYVNACNHCDKGTALSHIITIAEQTNHVLAFNE